VSEISQIIKDGARRIGKSLGDDAGRAVKRLYHQTGGNLDRVVENHVENDAKHADDLRRLHGDGDQAKHPHLGGGSSRPGGSRPGGEGGGSKGGGTGSSWRSSPSPRLRDSSPSPHSTSREPDARRCVGDPVDVATGEVVLEQQDVALPGALPLLLNRTHVSSYRSGRWFGPSWASTLDQRAELDDEAVLVSGDDGTVLHFPLPEAGGPEAADGVEDPLLPVTGPRRRLYFEGGRGRIRVDSPAAGPRWHFGTPEGQRPDRSDDGVLRLRLLALSDRSGDRIDIAYGPDGAPEEIRHSGGYRIAVDTEGPRVTGYRLLDESDEPSAAVAQKDADRTVMLDWSKQPQPQSEPQSEPRSAAASGPASSVELVRFGYDDHGHLSAVTDSSGRPTRFEYDGQGRLRHWTDRNRRRFRYLYDQAGRCAQARGDEGHLDSVFSYDTEALTTTVTDSLGRATVFRRNERGQVTGETNALGHTIRREWDEHDQLLSATDALGRSTSLEYDAEGLLSAVTHPDGGRTTTVRNSLGLPVEQTGPDGATIRFGHDERGRTTSVTAPGGAITRYRYDGRGHLAEVVEPSTAATRVTCDPTGQPVEISDSLGAVTRCRRDAFGRPVEVVNPSGGRTRITWTTEGLPDTRTGPDGRAERWRWDAEGNLMRYTDRNGGTTAFEYTHFDKVSARTQPDGRRYTFDYDTELHLVRVTDPDGREWRYEYDELGRLVGETDFNGRSERYELDAAGQVLTRTNGVGQTVSSGYDPLGHEVSRLTEAGTSTFSWDPAGRLLAAEAPDGLRLERAYDPAGRLLSETVAGRTISFRYDELGRRIERRTPSGASTSLAWDAVGNLTGLTASGQRIGFQRDSAGRETRRTFGSAADAGPVLDTSWDELGRLLTQTVTSASGERRRTHRYRGDGAPVGLTDSQRGEREYVLDPVGRVLAVLGDDWSESYRYDNAGNLVHSRHPYPGASAAGGELAYEGTLVRSAGRSTYRNDAQGRVVERAERTLSGKTRTWTFDWDAEDRLTEARTPDGSRWRYRYDPLGRRVSKQRTTPDGVDAERTEFTWDGPLLAEQTSYGPKLPGPYTLTWDHEGFRPVLQTERLEAPQAEVDRRFFAIVADLVGAPTELVSTADGSTAWRADGTLWGLTAPADATTATSTPLRFPGQYHDPETRLHYNLHRYYDPAAARYLTPDPLGLSPAPNPHAYVGNPLTATDPLGLAPCGDTESFYRGMSTGELENQLKAKGTLYPKFGETFVTQDRAYIEQLAARHPGKYEHLVKFNMQPGTRQALLDAGSRDDPASASIKDLGLDQLPVLERGQPHRVHVKAELGYLNFGLRKGSAHIFNDRIKDYSTIPWGAQ
jgi:RHS repeat-associated protein